MAVVNLPILCLNWHRLKKVLPDLIFIDEVKGGNIPREYIPSVEKGFREAMRNGILAGFPMESLQVTLKDGSFHPVDSDSLSFEIAAKQGFKHALKKGKVSLLEPMMKVEVVTPEEYMGDVIGDFNRRRGQITGMESQADSKGYPGQCAAGRNVRICNCIAYPVIGTGNIHHGIFTL